MKTRQVLLALSSTLLLAGCLFSRLTVEDGVEGGAGTDSNGGSSTNNAAGKSSGGKANGSGAGSESALAGEPNGGSSVVNNGGSSTGGRIEENGGQSSNGGSANGGTTSTGGNGGSTSPGGNGGTASGGKGGGATGGNGGSGGVPNDPNAVKKSGGCGVTATDTPSTFVKHQLQTMGTKPQDAADGKKGAWSYLRDYYVWLPTGYDKNKAYPIVLGGPGCGGVGNGIYTLTNAINNSAILIGLTPPPDDIVHSTNPNQKCFDDREGDDSVDFVFYETLMDQLNTAYCYDKNRVFASGNSSGSWLANELGNHYAGDAKYPIRGVLANTGGLPDTVAWAGSPSNKPMAGMWIHEIGDQVNPFSATKVAFNHALTVNACQPGTTFDTASYVDYPVSGVAAGSCKKVVGCPAAYPLVICPLPGAAHSGHEAIANPGFAQFVTDLEAP